MWSKKYRVLCCAALLALTGVSATAAGAEIKVGFVNVAKVLEKAPQAEVARSKLEKEFAVRDQELAKVQQELRDMEEKMSRDAAIMSDAERRKLERDIVLRQRDVKRSQEEFRDDLNIRRNEELGKLQRQVYEAIVALADQDKYDLILGDGVIYASDKVDLTEQLLARLRKAFETASQGKAPAGPAQ